jgi:3-ketoacyl-CoA synthase
MSVCLQIDIVIVSCSCFAPTPSMAAMITNHFKLRRDVLTYNLSGMGCSSSLICIDLVKHLLKVHPAFPPPFCVSKGACTLVT